MPSPLKKDESKQEFLSRCISYIIKREGKSQAQSVAICNSMYKQALLKRRAASHAKRKS